MNSEVEDGEEVRKQRRVAEGPSNLKKDSSDEMVRRVRPKRKKTVEEGPSNDKEFNEDSSDEMDRWGRPKRKKTEHLEGPRLSCVVGQYEHLSPKSDSRKENKKKIEKKRSKKKNREVLQCWDFYLQPKGYYKPRGITCETNVNVIGDIRNELSLMQLKKFRETCFGYFLDMPDIEVQKWVLHMLLSREVHNEEEDVLWFNVGEHLLRFGIEEFEAVTGLKCTGVRETAVSSNELAVKYFKGSTNVTPGELKDCLSRKEFRSDEDAVKIAVLYFVKTFLFSSPEGKVDIKYLNLVDHGNYNSYPWGKDVFEETIRSLNGKLARSPSFYVHKGFPLALQIWFYECCPLVKDNIASFIGTNDRPILNWRTEKPHRFYDVVLHLFNKSHQELHLRNLLHSTANENSKHDGDRSTQTQHSKEEIHSVVDSKGCTTQLQLLKEEICAVVHIKLEALKTHVTDRLEALKKHVDKLAKLEVLKTHVDHRLEALKKHIDDKLATVHAIGQSTSKLPPKRTVEGDDTEGCHTPHDVNESSSPACDTDCCIIAEKKDGEQSLSRSESVKIAWESMKKSDRLGELYIVCELWEKYFGATETDISRVYSDNKVSGKTKNQLCTSDQSNVMLEFLNPEMRLSTLAVEDFIELLGQRFGDCYFYNILHVLQILEKHLSKQVDLQKQRKHETKHKKALGKEFPASAPRLIQVLPSPMALRNCLHPVGFELETLKGSKPQSSSQLPLGQPLDKIFLPVVIKEHFFGACADLEKKKIFIFDSLKQSLEEYKPLVVLLQLLEDTIDVGKFTIIKIEGCPIQSDATSCGIFLCKYFEFCARGAEIPFDQNTVDIARSIMVPELEKAEILTDGSVLEIGPSKKLLRDGSVLEIAPAKKLLILDLNGILVEVCNQHQTSVPEDFRLANGQKIFRRPHYKEFLDFCFEKFEVAFWSSITDTNLDQITRNLVSMKKQPYFSWDQSDCTRRYQGKREYFFKELERVWRTYPKYNKSNTLLVDDSPYKALCNPAHTAIFPRPYKHSEKDDNCLGTGGKIRGFLEKLVKAPDVQEFVSKNPFGDQDALIEGTSQYQWYEHIYKYGSSVKQFLRQG